MARFYASMCLRQEQAQQAEVERQQANILVDYVQKDVKIAELEAELARYREYFEGLRLQYNSKNTRASPLAEKHIVTRSSSTHSVFPSKYRSTLGMIGNMSSLISA